MEMPVFLTPTFVISDDQGRIHEFSEENVFLSQSEREGNRFNVLDGLRVPGQERSLWCWAAVSAGIARYCLGENAPTQYDIAARTLNVLCNLQPSTDPNAQDNCDIALRIDEPLAHYGLLARMEPDHLKYSEVMDEIDADRPVVCFIAWRDWNKPGHFIVICGFLRALDVRYVCVQDPVDNKTAWSIALIPFGRMLGGYRRGLGGDWRRTYLINVSRPALSPPDLTPL